MEQPLFHVTMNILEEQKTFLHLEKQKIWETVGKQEEAEGKTLIG